MCLAIPGKVLKISDESGLKMGTIDFGGVQSEACLAYLPDIKIGDYAIVHAGFAISILDEDEAHKSLDAWAEMLEATGGGVDLDLSYEKDSNKDKPE